ncbi:MAG: serine/threonine protein kinase [Desertifilum sp.]|nr:serine/threonine protein kinase [Desertifilum sp.]
MSYCFNLACSKPHNPESAQFCQSCGSKLLLGDRYRAIEALGVGGFGRTLKATDEHIPSKPLCVIKQFFYGETSSQSSRHTQKASELFRQEALRLDELGQHPQIPNLLAYFTYENRQYLIQEFIDGQNLAQELDRNGAFSEKQVRELLIDLLPVLQFVCDHQVIHRDIKPDNIIRSQQSGKYMLVDFGAAKVASQTSLQKTGTVIGSAAYTAPEQLLGKATPVSDIYSLGVTCVHLLTQIPPFDLFDSTEGKWVWRHYLRTPISSQLARVLDKMLEPAIKNRFPSATSVLNSLNANSLPPNSGAVGFLSLALQQKIPPKTMASALVTASPNAVEVSPRNPELELKESIQEILKKYWLTGNVNLIKNQLSIVINREESTPVNYPFIVKEITEKVKELAFKRIETLKVSGKIQGKQKPEWTYCCDLKSAQPTVSDLVLLKLAQYTTQKFWLAQLKNRKFWLDCLLLSLMGFVLTMRIVPLHPVVAILTAVGFMGVKTVVKGDRNFQEDLLYKQVIAFTFFLGFLNINLLVRGTFGLLIAAIVMAVPLLYIKTTPS